MNKKKVGVVGMGYMGAAMTERFLDAGYEVLVHNRTASKADPLIAMGAVWCDNPIAECDRVVISLYENKTVRLVLEQMDSGLHEGQILIDTTTGNPDETAELGEILAKRGVKYIDAPISGSSEQTLRREVTTICGGDLEAFSACRDLFDCFSAKTFHVGVCGNAAKVKLVTNLVLGLNRAALAEGLCYAKAVGIEMKAALEVLLGSKAHSLIMDTKGEMMVNKKFSTIARLTQHLKDIQIILKTSAEGGLPLPLTEAHCGLLEKAEAMGHGDEDNSTLIYAYDNYDE